jgi:hypothetical protein
LKEKTNQESIKNNNNQKNKYHIWYKKNQMKRDKIKKKSQKEFNTNKDQSKEKGA